MVRPPPGLVTSIKEVASRAISSTTKGGASKLARPALKFQRPTKPSQTRNFTTNSTASSEPSFFQLLYQGVFTSVKSAAIPRPGPYTSQRLVAHSGARTSFRPRFSSSSARPRPKQQQSRFGPTPRPTLYPTQTSQLGLGAARKFSSSGYAVFENVVHNAPLALRALADQGKDGLDERKWRMIRKEIRKQERTHVKGKGAMIDSRRIKEEIKNEFEQYFWAPHSAQIVEEEEEEEPLSLVLVLDPEMPFTSTSSSSTLPFDPTYRLLPTSVLTTLESISQSYTSHSHHLRSLINRLLAAGLLDDPDFFSKEDKEGEGMYLDLKSGKRLWKVTFRDRFVTRGRLESILRGERNAKREEWEERIQGWDGVKATKKGKGEGEWWWIEGGHRNRNESNGSSKTIDPVDLEDSVPPPSVYLHSPTESISFYSPSTTSSHSSSSLQLDLDQSLVLPDPSSLEFSPPLSPSLEPTLWTYFNPSSSDLGFAGPELQDFDALESWSTQDFEDEGSTIEWSNAGSVVDDVEEEEEMDGVKQFLEEVERERERLESSGWR
ncbi:uncharacterized protein JCM6883_000656 [Sporobolomyces salmoneus]|uniref:uncharacterized protein n=1 Tax=Sporobolomyces salmoneus TaxID=183962 RepID=UPI003178A184